MKPNSRRLIYVGINFVIVPAPVVSPQSSLLFQRAYRTHGLDFQRLEMPGHQMILWREVPSSLRIAVGVADPRNPQFGQVLIVAENPQTGLDLFVTEAEAVIGAVNEVWPEQNRQVVFSDCTLRELHETSGQHAFQELWEQRLGQPAQALAAFGRPVRGGGLRFVMDPLPSEDDPAQIEVKIESWLADTSKIFVETVIKWHQPSVAGPSFRIRERLEQMSSYIDNQVRAFMLGEANDSH